MNSDQFNKAGLGIGFANICKYYSKSLKWYNFQRFITSKRDKIAGDMNEILILNSTSLRWIILMQVQHINWKNLNQIDTYNISRTTNTKNEN